MVAIVWLSPTTGTAASGRSVIGQQRICTSPGRCRRSAAAGYQPERHPRLLAHLTTENLFITSLDEQGEWFRYHPLFAGMLRAGLDEATRRECHRRAARWYAEQQLMPDVMHHTIPWPPRIMG
jgi:hypothetical protein